MEEMIPITMPISYIRLLQNKVNNMEKEVLSNMDEIINDKKEGYRQITDEGRRKHRIDCERANYLTFICRKVNFNPDWKIFKNDLIYMAKELSIDHTKRFVMKDVQEIINYMEAAEELSYSR